LSAFSHQILRWALAVRGLILSPLIDNAHPTINSWIGQFFEKIRLAKGEKRERKKRRSVEGEKAIG
jgi:hypothetical protein